MQRRRVVILDCNHREDAPHVVFVAMRERLAEEGVDLVVDNRWSADYAAAELIVGADPLPDAPELLDCRILGQRTLNRRTRLDVAATCGAPVAPFGGPTGDAGLDALAAEWGGGLAVLKYDWSARRNGVFLWPLDAGKRRPFPADFDPSRDVFMAFQEGDPGTYKIDTFAGVILNAYILPTSDMREPAWHAIRERKHFPFEPPPDLAADIRRVSRELLRHGAGYASFDTMLSGGVFRIIEMNTCGVGTAPWDDWPETYAENYAAGILAALADLDAVPRYRELREQALALGNDEQAVTLPRRDPAADAAPRPRGIAPELEFLQTLAGTESVSAAEMEDFTAGPTAALLRNARDHSPFYAGRLDAVVGSDGAVDLGRWDEIALLTRDDVALRRQDLLARRMPPVHGSIAHLFTAGTAHPPMTVSRSRFSTAAASVAGTRFYTWHDIAFAGPMATIRRPQVVRERADTAWAPRWIPGERGEEYELESSAPVRDQLEWLRGRGRVWLRSRPSLLQQMALAVRADPALKPELAGIVSSREILTADVRRLAREHLGHEPLDVYYLSEAETVAFQCPAGAWHVQAELVRVELLDEAGRPCRRGETGRVVVTPLYNLAMPMIRYDTGDLAVAGDHFDRAMGRHCPCGRRLPRFERLIGRARNLLDVPALAGRHPDLDSALIHDLSGAPLWQLRQEAPRRFVLALDAPGEPSADQARALSDHVSQRLGMDADVTVVRERLAGKAGVTPFEPFLRLF
ncbi:MAG: hypothetical protein AB7L41_07830 [Flavobacteriaceae bacterium]